MAYLNIVFHNIQHGGIPVNGVNSRANYTATFVQAMNVYQTPTVVGGGVGFVGGRTAAAPGGAAGAPAASAGWGACATVPLPGIVGDTACGIFLCESQQYIHVDYTHWGGLAPAVPAGIPTAIPAFPLPVGGLLPAYVVAGFSPCAALNTLCAFFYGSTDPSVAPTLPPTVTSPGWLTAAGQALACLGTGDGALFGPLQAPYGSDRYAILFQATRRTYPSGAPITGVFVHTKNTLADPGTQIATLCRLFPNEIIFGDLNFNLRIDRQVESLAHAVGATHTILAIQQTGVGAPPYYCTRYPPVGPANSCLDYALVPNAQVINVELWARQPTVVPTLSTNASDHSVMMLRIHCI